MIEINSQSILVVGIKKKKLNHKIISNLPYDPLTLILKLR